MNAFSKNPTPEFIQRFLNTLENAGLFLISRKLDPEAASLGIQDLSLEELGVDSFTLIAISVKIEEDFPLSLSPEKLAKAKTVMGIIRMVAAGIPRS